jgi:hypothetical protein
MADTPVIYGNRLYTLGYQGIRPEIFTNIALALSWKVLDIRFSPRSRNPGYSKKRLSEALGFQYTHLPALGNVNYKSGGPIEIPDLDTGLARLRRHLHFMPCLLLCVCKNYDTCHRKTVIEAYHAKTGIQSISVDRLVRGEITFDEWAEALEIPVM